MMVFITHCSKNQRPSWLAWLCALALWAGSAGFVRAETAVAETPELKIERIDDGLWLSTSLKFELPAVVEDALLKGIPIYFVAEADVLRERWYWTNRKLSSVQRQVRLAYHPLTRRWRLNVTAGEASEFTQGGLALNQNFDSVQDAMDAVRRVSHWRIADAASVEPGVKHLVEFRFRLDVAQLPRPLQIGTLGQSDWQIQLDATKTLILDAAK
jgi:hypothetical protein